MGLCLKAMTGDNVNGTANANAVLGARKDSSSVGQFLVNLTKGR